MGWFRWTVAIVGIFCLWAIGKAFVQIMTTEMHIPAGEAWLLVLGVYIAIYLKMTTKLPKKDEGERETHNHHHHYNYRHYTNIYENRNRRR